MATYRPAVSTATRRILKGLRQQEAVTGTRLEPDQIEAITRGELGAERDRALGFATLEQRGEQFDERMAIARDQIAKDDLASAVSGATDIAGLGASYYLTKGQIAAESANTEALREIAFKMGGGYEGLTPLSNLASEGMNLPAVGSAALSSGTIPTGFGGPAAIGEAAGLTSEFALTGEGIGAFETAGASALAETGGTVVGEAGVAGATTGATIAAGAGAAGAGLIGGKIGAELTDSKGGAVAGGAISGAIAGTYIFPVIGTVAGGVIGGLTALVQESTVICGELYEQGYLPVNVLVGDRMYATYHIDRAVYDGYRVWADPVVRLMRKSGVFTSLIAPFGVCWARTMANKVDRDVKVNRLQKLVGNTMLTVGTPVCRMLSQRRCVHG